MPVTLITKDGPKPHPDFPPGNYRAMGFELEDALRNLKYVNKPLYNQLKKEGTLHQEMQNEVERIRDRVTSQPPEMWQALFEEEGREFCQNWASDEMLQG